MKLPHAEKLEAARLAPHDAFLGRADTRFVRAPGWYQMITPSTRSTTLNEVVHSEIADADPEERIDAVLAEYARAGVPFKWVVSPFSKPADLAVRLERRGLTSWWARAMVLEVGAREPRPMPGGVRVENVTQENASVYASVSAVGWGADEAELYSDVLRAISHEGRRHAFQLAYLDDRPAGVAGYVVKGTSAYMIAAVVLEPLRGRGIYRALVDARLAELASRGVDLATTHAREATSAPILERLGFETMYRYRLFATD